MGSITKTLTTNTTTIMLKFLVLLSVASLGSALNCQECINEMHSLSFLIKQASPDIMSYLTANYCPGLEGHEEQCENDLTRNYVQMLFMIVQHFFVDGAQHICAAWNFCVGHPDRCIQAVKTHFPPMHAMTVEAFWKPQDICNSVSAACGATKPPQ